MTPNKRAIGILLGMLILAMVVGAVLNRQRSGGITPSLDGLLTPEQKPQAETPSPPPAEPEVPAGPEAAAPQVQPAAPPLWEELTPEGETPAWRKNAAAVLYALLPELAPPIPYVTPDVAPMPARSEQELAAERAGALELAAAALKRIAPDAPGAPGAAAPPRAVEPKKSPATTPAAPLPAQANAEPQAAPAPVAAQAAPQAAASAPSPIASPATAPAAKTAPGPEGPAAQAKPGLISEITLECGPSECLLRIETKPQLEHIAYFHKIQPARLALDLYGKWIFRGPNTLAGNEDFVERIRLGVHPDKFRVVLDFKGDQDSIRKEPVIEKRGNTLLVKIPK